MELFQITQNENFDPDPPPIALIDPLISRGKNFNVLSNKLSYGVLPLHNIMVHFYSKTAKIA